MRAAEPLSVFASGAAERAFANEPFIRRLAKIAGLGVDHKVLQLSAGDGSMGILLAQQLRCRVLVVDENEALLSELEQKAKALSLGDRLETRKASLADLDGEGTFRVVLSTGAPALLFQESAEKQRAFLMQDGRLCRLYPVRMGLGGDDDPWSHAWQDRLGEPLPSPAQLLRRMETAGFEPETVESLGELELEAVLRADPPSESEVALYRPPTSTPHASVAVAVGRRKEPGEKPPTSGDRG